MSNEEIIIDYVLKSLETNVPLDALYAELSLLNRILKASLSYDWVNIIRAALQDGQEKEMQQGQQKQHSTNPVPIS